jgi:hypothetical protein
MSLVSESLMKKLRIEQLQEGMVVEAEVRNMDGTVLLPAGAVLTRRFIDILSAWGVPEVCVKSTDDAEERTDPLARLMPGELARLQEETRSLFWSLDESSAVQQEVFQQILRRKARRLLPL